jgi:hypothetical protein
MTKFLRVVARKSILLVLRFYNFNQATRWEPVPVVRTSLRAANLQSKVGKKALKLRIRQVMPLLTSKSISKHHITMADSKTVLRVALRTKKWTPSTHYQTTYPLTASTLRGLRL